MSEPQGSRPLTDADESPTDHTAAVDYRKGSIPSHGLARYLYDLDIEEFNPQNRTAARPTRRPRRPADERPPAPRHPGHR